MSAREIVNFNYVLIKVLCFVMDYELRSLEIAHKKHITIPPPSPPLPPKTPRASKKRRRYLAPAASLPVSVTVARAAD